ncbi:MAG TPA: serine protease [Pirellulales bacterium]|nr:serine protease [Pirellulales bacterium]
MRQPRTSYAKALPEGGPRVEWFVNVALDRGTPGGPATIGADDVVKRLIDVLQSFGNPQAGQVKPSAEVIRHTLAEAQQAAAQGVRGEPAAALARAAAAATERLLTDRICPSGDAKRFVVRGREDADGVNWTLRRDLDEFGRDAVRLREIAACKPELLSRALIKNLSWIARWHVYIASRWEVTPGTMRLFEQLRATLAASLPAEQSDLAAAVVATDFGELAGKLSAEGVWPTSAGPLEPVNRYLKNVDDEIADVAVRQAIRRVQPACVRLGGGSGVNVSPRGCVLTAAHVARQLGARLTAEFPNGRRYTAECVALDQRLDVALCRVLDAPRLPFAKLASAPATVGTRVVCIGQPGTRTPAGKPTDYQPFHVSTGEIRGFLDDRLGDQALGRTKHDAWTYWGHSGSPLFNEHGEIVAMHNSWDSKTAMRHAVTHEALAEFLKQHRAELATE